MSWNCHIHVKSTVSHIKNQTLKIRQQEKELILSAPLHRKRNGGNYEPSSSLSLFSRAFAKSVGLPKRARQNCLFSRRRQMKGAVAKWKIATAPKLSPACSAGHVIWWKKRENCELQIDTTTKAACQCRKYSVAHPVKPELFWTTAYRCGFAVSWHAVC